MLVERPVSSEKVTKNYVDFINFLMGFYAATPRPTTNKLPRQLTTINIDMPISPTIKH